MALDDDLRNASKEEVRKAIERRDFLKKVPPLVAGVYMALTGRRAEADKKTPAQKFDSIPWRTVVQEDLTDNVFDKPNQYPVKINTGQFTESSGTLYMAGPNPSIVRFMTQELYGQIKEITDYNVVNLLPSEWEGIHIGKLDNSVWLRFIFENYAGAKRYRFKTNTTEISTKPFNATQRFSLMVVRDANNELRAYVAEDFNPADPIDRRNYQPVTGSTNISGSVAGGIAAIINGGPTFELTRFMLQQPVSLVKNWNSYR